MARSGEAWTLRSEGVLPESFLGLCLLTTLIEAAFGVLPAHLPPCFLSLLVDRRKKKTALTSGDERVGWQQGRTEGPETQGAADRGVAPVVEGVVGSDSCPF